MTCRTLHEMVEAKCAIRIEDEEEAAIFAALACSLAIRLPRSKGLANTYCIELAFDLRNLDMATSNNLCQALLSLPHLTEVNVWFPLGSTTAWEMLLRLIPTCIARLRLKSCFLTASLLISRTIYH